MTPNDLSTLCMNPGALAPPTGAPETPFYSWVTKRGNFVFLAGMSPYSKDKKLIGETLYEQTQQAFRNMREAMHAAGGSMSDVCSITVYVQDTDLQANVYPQVNSACREAFGDRPPARAVVGGLSLPRPTERVMISGMAILAS